MRRIDAEYLVEYGNKNELTSTMQFILDKPAESANKTQKAKEYIEANRLNWVLVTVASKAVGETK